MLKQADTTDAKHFIESMKKLKGVTTTSNNIHSNSVDPVADKDESNSQQDPIEMMNKEAK